MQLFLRHFQIAAQLDVADGVTITFSDIYRDVDVFLVRRNGHLSRGDVHVDIAAIQVIRAQTFKVTGKLLPGILVVVAEERQPVAGLQLEQIGEIFVGEYGIADNVDVLNRRNGAFVNIYFQRDAVARLRNDLSFDRSRVAPLRNILTLQLVAHALERGALEDFTFCQARLLQAGKQVFSLDRLVAVDLDAGD